MSKHTPGPWRVYGDDTNIFVGQTDSDNENACDGIRQVCEVKQGDSEIPDYDEAAANAQLIAAAPDLLEALEAILQGFQKGDFKRTHPRQSNSDPYHPALIAARDAITRAKEA